MLMIMKPKQQMMNKIINEKAKYKKSIFNMATFCNDCPKHAKSNDAESGHDNLINNQAIIMHPKYAELSRQIMQDLIDGDA